MESRATEDHGHTFEQSRRRLWGIAYRMLGSRADADDLVQETYLRWHRAPGHYRPGKHRRAQTA
jgi:RNA polymerase sigma-70 factor (ECF subfamily)